jgi:hypothetical protein
MIYSIIFIDFRNTFIPERNIMRGVAKAAAACTSHPGVAQLAHTNLLLIVCWVMIPSL